MGVGKHMPAVRSSQVGLIVISEPRLTPLDQLFVAARQFADENSCLPESRVSPEITSCRPLLFLPAAIASPEVFLPAQRNESLSTAAKLSSSLLSHNLNGQITSTTNFRFRFSTIANPPIFTEPPWHTIRRGYTSSSYVHFLLDE